MKCYLIENTHTWKFIIVFPSSKASLRREKREFWCGEETSASALSREMKSRHATAVAELWSEGDRWMDGEKRIEKEKLLCSLGFAHDFMLLLSLAFIFLFSRKKKSEKKFSKWGYFKSSVDVFCIYKFSWNCYIVKIIGKVMNRI